MLHLLLKGLGVGVAALALAATSALWPSDMVDPVYQAPDVPRSYGAAYEPLRPGTMLTYRTADGSAFVREVMQPMRLQWWDDSVREVIPVYDGRIDGYFFYLHADGEIRVVGSLVDGQLERWGEYEVVVPATAPTVVREIATPAGTFKARQVIYPSGTAWFAEGVGLIGFDDYRLADIKQVTPRQVEP